MLIYLMRHGQTDWNTVHRMQGRTDIPLNATGRAEARAAAAGMRGLPFDRILSSPLRRAQETAAIVAEGRGLSIEIEPLLVEMDFGSMEGTTLAENPAMQQFFSHPEQYRIENGESLEELDRRCRRLLREVILPMEGAYRHVLLVAHGAFNRGLQRAIEGFPTADFWNSPPMPNCSLTIIEVKEGHCTLLEQGKQYR